ncbi:MAG: CDP-alcohol phosphatidyltransferase family protein [bacterium]|jgi:cardiolipin synthase
MRNLLTANLTLANRITIGRLLLIPVYILVTLYYIQSVNEHHPEEMFRWFALMLYVITCLTDALDGYFARSRNEITRLGTLLDPLADKTLLISSLILLTGPWGQQCFNPHLPLWYVFLVISRDVFLVIGAVVIHVAVGHTEVKPRLSGKIATFFQMILILWVLGQASIAGFPWLLWSAAGFTLVAAYQYIADGIRQLEKAHAHK